MQFSLVLEQGSWEFTRISLRLSPRPLPAPASHAKGQGPCEPGRPWLEKPGEKEGRKESTCC